jgi:hypothetical protein
MIPRVPVLVDNEGQSAEKREDRAFGTVEEGSGERALIFYYFTVYC